MASASSLYGLMKFLKREEWRDAYEEVQFAHFHVACHNAGIEEDELAAILGDQLAMTLWGCAFEDLLTRELPDGRNMVDDYLKRRGYKESASAKAYMRAVRSSVMSLYEVSDIVPGQSFLARDLIRGGEPVRVVERTATKQMEVWDRMAARIVPLAGTYQMCGGVLVYGLETSEKLMAKLAWFEKRAEQEMHDVAEEFGTTLDAARLADLTASGAWFAAAAPIFTRIWLMDALVRALNRRLPKLVNTDGDAIVFCTLSFPLVGSASASAVCSALAAVEDLESTGDTSFSWIRPLTGDGGGTGSRILGSIEVRGSDVIVMTNSRQRAERAKAKFSDALAGSVGEPTLETETPEEAMANRKHTPRTDEAVQKLVLPPDEERRIVHSCLDDHYRRTLDQGVPMLDGMTPRQAANTAAGRAKVASWLKYLENQSRKLHEPGNPLGTHDLGWLWTELGVEELRV